MIDEEDSEHVPHFAFVPVGGGEHGTVNSKKKRIVEISSFFFNPKHYNMVKIISLNKVKKNSIIF